MNTRLMAWSVVGGGGTDAFSNSLMKLMASDKLSQHAFCNSELEAHALLKQFLLCTLLILDRHVQLCCGWEEQY